MDWGLLGVSKPVSAYRGQSPRRTDTGGASRLYVLRSNGDAQGLPGIPRRFPGASRWMSDWTSGDGAIETLPRRCNGEDPHCRCVTMGRVLLEEAGEAASCFSPAVIKPAEERGWPRMLGRGRLREEHSGHA